MTKRKLIEALEALDCPDDTEVEVPLDEYGTEPITVIDIMIHYSKHTKYILLQ